MLTLQTGVCDDGRHCGSCTACCTHLSIPAGVVGRDAKPAGVACVYVGALGCRKHARRPAACAAFRCEWLRDSTWQDSWRPDRVGLLSVREACDEWGPSATIHEIRPGALRRPEAAGICDALLRTTAGVVIVDTTGRRFRLAGMRASAETQFVGAGAMRAQPAA